MLWDVGSEFIYGLVYILIWAEMLIDRLKNGLLFNGPDVQWVLLFLISTNLLGPFANGHKLTHLLDATSSSTSASMWQARHNHFPRHCHVIWYANEHVILHCIYVWRGNWICDDVCDVFIIKNGLGLDFGGPRIFYDGFKTLWIKQSMMIF